MESQVTVSFSALRFSRAASHSALLYLMCAMASPVSCVSTASHSDESFAHNIWSPLMELPFHVQTCGIFETFVAETNLARIAPSCHYPLGLLCDKEFS